MGEGSELLCWLVALYRLLIDMGLVQVTLMPLVIAFHYLLSSPCISNTVGV